MSPVVKLDTENTGDRKDIQIDLVVHFVWRQKWPEVVTPLANETLTNGLAA